MLGFIFKKFRKKTDQPKNAAAKLASKLQDNSEKLAKLLGEKFQLAQDEFLVIKNKCNNLQETNFKLGLKHLEKGNLPEAIFRFRLMKKMWPQFFDAYYYLAYSLVLKEKPQEAKKTLLELLEKNPNYDPKAKELLQHLNKSVSNA